MSVYMQKPDPLPCPIGRQSTLILAVVVDGLLFFWVEKVKAKAASFSFSAATGAKGGRTHDDGLCFRANAAHSWQTSLSSLRNALFPLVHPWWWAQPTVHAPGGHQLGLHRGRPSRARFLLDFDQDIRSDLQRWVPSACAKCLLQHLLDCKQLERQKAEPLHFNKHSHRSALVRRGRRSAVGLFSAVVPSAVSVCDLDPL